MSALQARAARTNATPQAAPPVMRRAAPQGRFAAPPIASLAAIPAVQRKCTGCEQEDKEQTAVQPRLEVGPVGDRYEREADGIAAQVMAMSDPGAAPVGSDASGAEPAVQRACSACSTSRDEPRARRFAEPKAEEEKEPKVRASRDGGAETIAASDSELTSGGATLPASTRGFFESRMGRDLGDVRVHEGGGAAAMNDSISARAFTYKNHVWLGSGESAGPSFTMAHELAHVMQQTAPGPVGPARRRLNSSTAMPAVQRKDLAFWLPGVTTNAKGLHTTMHDKALDAIRAFKPNILTEVPIPGANRNLVDIGEKGRADIYTADGDKPTVPGVQQVAAPKAAGKGASAAPSGAATTTTTATPAAASIADLNNFSPKMPSPMEQGSSIVVHDTRRAPKIENKRLTGISSAPKNILIGEMKPHHDLDYRKSGAQQVANYIAGIAAVETKVNAVAGGWTANPKVIDGSKLIPPNWDASRPQKDWGERDLKIRYYAPDKAKPAVGAKAKPKAKAAHQGRPKTQPIRGRWMMAADTAPGHKGVIVYFLAPNPTDLDNALKSSSTRAKFRALVGKLKKIQQDLINSPKPVGGTVKVKPRRRSQPAPIAGMAPPMTASAMPQRLVRKEVKDHFRAADWDRERTGVGLPKGAKNDSLLANYGEAAGDALREEIAEQGGMVEWLKTKPETKGTQYPDATKHIELTTDLDQLKRVEFWTGNKARPFGILREKFGLFFVKAFEKVSAFGKRLKEKFKSFSEGKILAGRKGTIVKAAAKVAAVVLPRLAKPFLAKMFDTIIDCGVIGFEAKFRELIEGTAIEGLIDTADEIKEKVNGLAADAEQYFKDLIEKAVGPIESDFEKFVGQGKLAMEAVSIIAEIARAIRIGSCVAGLAAAPETVGIGAVIGCGAALGDYILSKFGLSPLDHLIGSILSSCDMQNKVGKAMAEIDFIRSLPKTAGIAVVEQVKSMLANSESLRKLGSFNGRTYAQHASELFCDPTKLAFPYLGYEPDDCGGTGDYRHSKTGAYDIPDDVPLYANPTHTEPIPPEERPWMGNEVPPGREGALNPMPGPSGKGSQGTAAAPPPAPTGSPPPSSGSPGGKDKSVGIGGTSTADTTSRGNLKNASGATGQLYLKADIGPSGKYSPIVPVKAYAYGKIAMAGLQFTINDAPVQILVEKIYKAGEKVRITFRFYFEDPSGKDNVIFTDSATGMPFELYNSRTKSFDWLLNP